MNRERSFGGFLRILNTRNHKQHADDVGPVFCGREIWSVPRLRLPALQVHSLILGLSVAVYPRDEAEL